MDVVDVSLGELGPVGQVEADLVEDLARLLLRLFAHLVALELGEHLEDSFGQGRVGQQGHPAGQQRVPAEDGHIPWGARGQNRQVGTVGVEYAQGPQVLAGAGYHRVECRIGGRYLGKPGPP